MADNPIEATASSDRKSRTAGVIWGLPKCGKTTFMTSLPGKKLFVMLDPDGDQSIPDRDDVDIMRLYEQPDDVIMRWLEGKMPSFIQKNAGKYDSYVYDSLSTLYRVMLNEAIKNEVGGSNKFTPSLDTPGLTAYGSRTNHMLNIANKNLRATAAVGAHCWFTSHEDEPKTNDKGEFLYITMNMSGKAINGLGLEVSEIWHMRLHDDKWWIMIKPARGKQPMGSRVFDMTAGPEFRLKFIPDLGPDQPHSIATWYQEWLDGGKRKLPLPK